MLRFKTTHLALTIVLVAALGTGCRTVKDAVDPTLLIQTPGGIELGVATDYGVVFLGQTRSSGEVDIGVWYGDGASIESSVIEPIGNGIFTAEIDIRMPTVPLSFETPEPGQKVLVVGRSGRKRWTERLKIVSDPHLRRGMLLEIDSDLADDPSQIGAGVYVFRDETEELPYLLGLVSGRLRVAQTDGSVAEYLTVVGPEDLWRLVVHRRALPSKAKWVYREDIL